MAEEAIANYTENQLIYEEFNYYQEYKEVLGVHPVFRKLNLKKAVKNMSLLNADKRKRNLKSYVLRGKRNLPKIKDPLKLEASEHKIKLWQEEIDTIIEIHKLDE